MKRNSLSSKLLRTSIVVTAILILIVFSMFFQYYMKIQKTIQDEQMRMLSENVTARADSAFVSLDDIALQLSTNSYITETMRTLLEDDTSGDIFEEDLRLARYLQSFIWSYIIRSDVATRICIYNRNGDFLNTGSSADSASSVRRYISTERLDRLDAQFLQGRPVVWMICAEDPLWQDSSGYICAVRQIRDSTILSSPPLGYVEVQLSLKRLEKSIVKLRQADYALSIIETETGIEVIEDSAIESGDSVRFIRETVTENGMLTCRLLGSGRVLSEARDTMLGALLIVSISLIVVMGIVLRQSIRRIIQPLLELFEQTRQSGIKEVSSIGSSQIQYDEVEGLRHSFEEMMASLRRSSDELVASQTSKIRAQLLAMQAQIDPHFIHNTLAVISALTREGRVEKAEDVITKLSSMIRYSTSFEQPMCTIRQELEHLQNYLELLSIRYEDCFFYSINGNGADSDCCVPRFITQPIVENSLRHSLKYTEYPWEITVQCEINAYEWRIVLCDSGLGITAEKSSEIMQQIAREIQGGVDNLVEQLKIGKLSLLNIVARLYLNYGDDMVFCISPGESGGTKVTLGGNIQ